MSITLDTLLPSAITLIVGLVSLIGMWFRFQNKVDNLIDQDLRQQHSIDDFWAWKQSHERDSFAMRESIQKELSRIEGHNMVTNEQFKQIVNLLTDIQVRLSKLEDNQRRKE